MSMKKFVFVSLLMACMPFLVLAQTNDDLYFIPKKKTEKKVTSGTPAKVVIEKDKTPTTVYASPGSTVVVKDVNGELRDVDEYNRRYTSRDNTFSMENDTLYIEEKPYNERGEWVNGFEGSQSDYEYAMRIVRFRNPRYAIPVSSPLYWDVVYALPSWEWNVYDDGFYAYAFPTYSNSLWWDWRFDYSWGWRSSWYYSSWYGPGYWYGGYWGGWPHYHHHHHWHPGHHHYPHYAWGGVGGYWGGGHGWNGSSARNPGIHAGRYTNNYRGNYAATGTSSSRRVAGTSNRNSRDNYVNSVRQSSNRNGNTVRNSGRVVTAKDGSSSVRPQRSAVRGRNNATVNSNKETTGVRSHSVYTRPSQGRSSSYNRQSSTRSTVNNTQQGSSYQRKSGAAERGAYRSNSSSRSSNNNRSSYSNSRSSSSRSSYSSGSSSSRSSYSSGGGSSSRSSGGSRSGGGRR